jgi:isoleucyl-tRNA synthetase
MEAIRYIVSKGLELRAKAGIKVRQPLAAVILMAPIQTKELENVIVEELNVKSVRVEKDPVEMVGIDTNITPELKLEMEAREIIRAIQEGRKKAGFNVEDRISLGYTGKDSVFANTELAELIAHEVLATSVQFGVLADADYSETVDIEGESFTLSLKRV